MISVVGKIVKFRKKKRYTFIDIIGKESTQLICDVTNADILECISALEVGDIISAEGKEDVLEHNRNSIMASTIKLIAKVKKQILLEKIDIDALKIKANVNIVVRQVLQSKGFLEIDLPILMASETSSASKSFVTKHFVSNQEMYLRKSLDVLLRVITANNIDKVYSFGRCFRNEHVTSNRSPEFEMLSIYANYYSLEDMIEICQDIITECGAMREYNYQKIDYEQYRLCKEELDTDTIYIVTKFNITPFSNAKTNESGEYMQEFKFITCDGTILHGLVERDTEEQYNDLLSIQNMKICNKENLLLKRSLIGGTAPCSSVGISINRLISFLYPKIKGVRKLEAFQFEKLRTYK